MPFYENESCPVCHRQFEDGDDIVVCPECGTPHHRQCYSLAGHCANEGLHKSGFSFNKTQSGTNDRQPAAKTEAEKQAEENKSGMPFAPFVPQEAFNPPKVEAEDSNETIDGNKISDVASAVRTNTSRFISIFKKIEGSGKKAGWNWGAFFFGSLYYFFRKMYKQGITLLCLFCAVIFGSNLAFTNLAPKTSEALINLYSLYQNGDANAIMESSDLVTKASDYKTALLLSYATIAIIIIIRIFEALFADNVYKNKIKETIKSVSKLLEEGASFTQNPIGGAPEFNLSQNQMKQLYLAKKGGISPFAPCIAFIAMEIIIQLISSIG